MQDILYCGKVGSDGYDQLDQSSCSPHCDWKWNKGDPHFFHKLTNSIVIASTIEDLATKTGSTLIPVLSNKIVTISQVIEFFVKT